MMSPDFSNRSAPAPLDNETVGVDRGAWSGLEYVEVDEIFGLDAAFKLDPRPEVRSADVAVGAGKMNLSIGVFVHESGELHVSEVINHARGRRHRAEGISTPYLNQTGYAPFIAGVERLIYGVESSVIGEGRVSTVQSVGGGNALFMGGMLYKEAQDNAQPHVLLSENSWVNHPKIFNRLGYHLTTVTDFDRQTRTFNGAAFLEAVENLSSPTLILLQPSSVNPTGNVAPAVWWHELKELLVRKNEAGGALTVFFDVAYQGLGYGLREDVAAVRLFAEAGIPTMTAWSGSKNFSLYGSRVGALTVTTATPTERGLVHANLCEIVRAVQSNCPRDGAELVGDVLSDPKLIAVWNQELAVMRSVLKARRDLVAKALESHIPGYDTSFIRQGEGFFSHLGLTDRQTEALRESGIYFPMKGRIAYPLFRAGNVEYFAQALKQVLDASDSGTRG